MNVRKIWTELFQKPAGRLVLFLLVGGIFLTFILTRRGPHPKPDNTPIASQATQAKSYSFKEDIQPLSATQTTPAPREVQKVAAQATPTPKPPQAIPQTIFATKEQSVSDWFLPYGRLLRCELVNTVESTNIDTPIVGLVMENAWNDGRVIIPAGTEVHGVAQKSPVTGADWFGPGVVFRFSGWAGAFRLGNSPGLCARFKESGFMGAIGRLGGPARICREVGQIRRSQSHACRDDLRGRGRFPRNDHACVAARGCDTAQQWWNRRRLFRRTASRRATLL